MFTRLQIGLLVGGCLAVIVALFLLHRLRPGALSFGSAGLQNSAEFEILQPVRPDKRQKASRKVEHPHVPTPFPAAYFKITVTSKASFKEPDRKQNLDAQCVITYNHEKTIDGVSVSFYSLELRMLDQGKPVESVLVTRDKCVKSRGTIASESSFDDLAPDEQEKMLCAFGTNIYKVLLDADRNEIGRERLGRPGPSIINEGIFDTTRIFHGPYPSTGETWKRSMRIPMEMGLHIDCPVTYTRGTGPGSVALAGNLETNQLASATEGVSIQRVSCDISGTETFDQKLGDYTAGNLTIRFGFQVMEKDSYLGTLEGELDLLLERVSARRTNSN